MTTINVTSNADSGANTLREAIDNSSNGNIILISSSISTIALKSNISINHGLTIRYNGGINKVTITCENTLTESDNMFTINAGNGNSVDFHNIIFSQGASPGAGAIFSNSGTLNLHDCEFLNFGNSINNYTCVTVDNSTKQFSANNCLFSGMKGTYASAAIYINKRLDVTESMISNINNCTFMNSQDRRSYGIYIVSENGAYLQIGVNDCEFISNSQNKSVAVIINSLNDGIVDFTMRRSIIERPINTTSDQRGVEVYGSTKQNKLLFDDCKFNNLLSSGVDGKQGAAIYLDLPSPVRLGVSNCEFTYNKSVIGGGAIGIGADSTSHIYGYIRDSLFEGNEAIPGGPPGTVNYSGGAVYLRIGSLFGISNCTFRLNKSSNGGAVYANTFYYNQGRGTLVIANCKFENNTSTSSGAIAAPNQGKLIVNRCVFIDNKSVGSTSPSGGGTTCILIFSENQSETNIISSCFVRNKGGFPPVRINVIGSDIYTKQVRIENCTFAENETTDVASAIAFDYSSEGTIILNNNTIANNSTTDNVPAIKLYDKDIYIDPKITLNNNLIFNNQAQNGEYNIDSTLTDFTKNNSYNNIVSMDDYILTNGINGNIIGTSANPILVSDLHVGPLNNTYGGDTYVIPLEIGSPAINAGNPGFKYWGEFDQRGSPYVREYNGDIDIGAFEFQDTLVPCFDGESLIVTRNIKTKAIDKTPAKNVYAGVHEVFDTVNKKFIPIIHNTVTDGATRIVLFKKNSLGPNKPNQDFKITSGHMMLVDGKSVKARDVKGGKKMTVKPQKVYSIVTKTWTPIKINNLDVYTWSEHKWHALMKKKGVCWVENKP